MDDPRFQHVASDPRFKVIPKRARKVTIDPRFQSMFSGKQFKIKYNVDKRGRKVKESSGENLRKYYELEEDEKKVGGSKLDASVGREEQDSDSGAESALESCDSLEEEGSDVSTSEDDESLCDLYLPRSGGEGQVAGRDGEGWREEDNVPLSEDTSRRLALCNMDWDRMGAEDVFVLLNSFKPAGASVVSVTVYPSDFGLERMAREELKGPMGIGGGAGMSGDEGEGAEYSEEKLRQYQLSRFKYYYAIVECDSVRTAEHLYQQCNGLEYEHSGGQLDLRFVPDDMSFEDRQPKSVASEDSIKPGFVPSDFVSSALQQSKVKLKWDETDPHRLHVMQRKFTKDDLQSMNFSAYLASSSESEEEGPEKEAGSGEEGEEEKEEDKAVRALRYKELLGVGASDKKDADCEDEVMEITWEPGLVETAEKLVKKKKKGSEKATPWEQYLQRKKEKRNEMKRKRRNKDDSVPEGETSQDAGFDDPFFHHSVTTATAGATKKKGKKKEVLGETEKQEKDELELLVMSEEEGEGQQQHFSLDKIMRSEREPGKRKKRGRKERDAAVSEDTFKVDVADPRFEALYESHLYAPDPSAPQYRATKGMSDLMTEKQRRGQKRAAEGVASQSQVVSAPKGGGAASEGGREGRGRKKWRQDPATGQPLLQTSNKMESLDSLVASVKFKTKERKKKLK